MNDHDRKLMNIYPLIRNSQHRNNTPNEKKILSAQKKEKTIQRQLSSKFSQTPAKNNIKNSIESFDNQTDIIDESNEKFTPKETHQENSFHRKSISLERSKYSELNFESPSKDRIKKCTFNDDTPKKVSFPKENDLTKTQKSKSNYENVFDQKKPTSNEYSAFISSPDYYKEKVGEIMNSFHDNEEIQFDEEDPVGKVNILDLKKSVEDPPSFASFGNIPEQEIPHKNEILIQNCKLEGNNKKEYQKSKSIGEKSNDNLQKDRDKNAIIIYYDNEKGLSDDIKIDLNQFDCKFYNLCTNQIEKPVLQVHNKFKLGK